MNRFFNRSKDPDFNHDGAIERNYSELEDRGYTDVRGANNLEEILQSKKYVHLMTFINEIFIIIDPDMICDISRLEKKFRLEFKEDFSLVVGIKSPGQFRLRNWALENKRFDILLQLEG